jgi:hypothetical protein
MKSLIFAASALLLAQLATTAADAQQRAIMPRPQLNPNMSLSAPTTNPLQAQMREDYATGLRSEQRELMQQNPSGLGRQELAIGQALNGYVAPR